MVRMAVARLFVDIAENTVYTIHPELFISMLH